MPGMASNRGRVVEHDRAEAPPETGGDDRQRNLQADAVDRQQVDEEVALVRRAEAVELQRVLADVQVRLDRQIALARVPQHGGCRLDEVADAVDVEHQPGSRKAGRTSAQPRDHAGTGRGAVAWQIATASASEAWLFRTSRPGRASPSAAAAPCRRAPYPHTACFTCAGAYSTASTPAPARATSTTPARLSARRRDAGVGRRRTLPAPPHPARARR